MKADVEQFMMERAGRQHGVVTRRELLDAGHPRGVVDRALRGTWVRRLHRGVYQVGPATSPHTTEVAAVLACGPTAVLSHRSAAQLWGILAAPRRTAKVDVSVTAGHPRVSRIRIHRPGALQNAEITRIKGVPVTTPTRTLYDLAEAVSLRELERALGEAFARGLSSRRKVLALADGHTRRRGSRRLRDLLREGIPGRIRSEAEARFLALVRRAGLPPPEVNVWLAGYEVDFLWREEKLVVELDGYGPHSAPRAFEVDRRRSAAIAGAGLRLIRFTWRRIEEEPYQLVKELTRALG